MKFFAAALLLTGTLAAAYQPCPAGANSNPSCCANNVLNVAALDCKPVPRAPDNPGEFQSACTKIGKQPLCCAVSVAGQGVLCQKPVGVN